jgi:hypothetical protein
MPRNGGTVASIAGWIWRFFRILWVCRVAAFSALVGGLLIANVDQARDLFADTGLAWYSWLVFFVLLFVWAWLVHGMGRRALQFDEWMPEWHVPGGLDGFDRSALRKPYYGLAVWMPRLLGLVIFLATAWALQLTLRNLLPATGLEQAQAAVSQIWKLLVCTALTGAAYLGFVAYWRGLRARMMKRSQVEEPLLIGAQSVLLLGGRAILHPKTGWPKFIEIFHSPLNRTLVAVAIFVTLLFMVAIAEPNAVSDWFPRVIFVPILLGGFVLLLGEIASLSHRYATPLLVCFFVVGGFMGYWLKYYNDVRWVAPAKTSATTGADHQLGLLQAIERWRVDNKCEKPKPCPRPIVIAGAGGASRAGFFTASVVGAMIDAGAADPASGLGDVRSRIFALSTVSGSSVGAVMMRAAWMDALQKGDIGKPPCVEAGTTAWFRGVAATPMDKGGAKPAAVSWRDCFQKLMAGDFLSPVFVGFTYRDIFPLGSPISRKGWGQDRSGLLEQSFERWYRAMTGADVTPCDASDNSGLCRRLGHLPDRPDLHAAGDWIPLLFVNGTSVSTGRRIIVSDIRIGCIVADDRRFLELAYDYRELRDPAVRKGHDRCAPSVADEGKDIDMRLSTVALMSARFPLVSTQGVIRDIDGAIVDSVVDGGYFENDGLATSADIVRELQTDGLQPVVIRIVNEPDSKIDDSLKLGGGVRNSQKVDALTLSGMVHRDGEDEPIRPALPAAEERTLFDVYTSIGRALYATRSGHEEGHLAYLRATLNGPLVRIGVDAIAVLDPARPVAAQSAQNAFCRSPVKVATAMDFVSMSWWMSQPVQAYLDAQLCRPQVERLMCVLKLKENDSATCG